MVLIPSLLSIDLRNLTNSMQQNIPANLSNNTSPTSQLSHGNHSPVQHHTMVPMTYSLHDQTSPSMVDVHNHQNGSPSHIEHHHQNLSPNNQHHILTPMQYTHQLPSPVTTNAPTNLINPTTGKYIHQYLVHQPNVDVQSSMITPPSYSPIQSPKYYGMPQANMINEHEIKIENNNHNVIHVGHINHSVHNIHSMHQQNSRSPSVEDEKISNPEANIHELQSQIMARNAERPTVVNAVNIKME